MEIGRLREFQSMIKLKCVEDSKHKREEERLQEAECQADGFVELEATKNENTKAAPCKNFFSRFRNKNFHGIDGQC